VVSLQRRIRNLECVKDAHLNLLDQIWQGTRYADEPHLTCLLQCQRRSQRAALLELAAGETAVELDQVQIIRLHPPQALFHTCPDVLGSVDMVSTHSGIRNATAFGGEEVLGAAMRDEAPDQFLAASLVY